MKKDFARWTWPAVVMAALVWAANCRGQGLEIDIPVPEPEKTATDGKDAAKRKAPQRRENPPTARRGTREKPGEALPAASPAGRVAPPTSENDLTHAPSSGRQPRAWEGTVGDGESAPMPTWANPAAIPLRQHESSLAAPMPESPEAQPTATNPSSRRTPASRVAGSAPGSPSRSGLFGRGLLSAKGKPQPDNKESTPLVARRHRTTPRDHSQDPLAPPSPWGNKP